jgi:hypothetical protein
MRRRRYLQAAALGASGLAGCNAPDQPTDTPTPTAVDTTTPTESPTATPRPEPPAVDAPDFIELLPRKHLKGTEETPNANFVRVDWDWYLSHYDTEMRFGASRNEDWTLEANAGNLNETPPPQYRLLHTPVGTAIQTAGAIANLIPWFPNLGPELVRQCGMEMEPENGGSPPRADYTDVDTAEVDEIISYAAPGFTFFVGVDVPGLESALRENDQRIPENFPDTTLYSGTGRASGRGYIISEAWDHPLLLVETADSEDEQVIPPFERVAGVGQTKNIAAIDSIRWALSEFNTDLPIQVGQINGGRARFPNTTYVQSPIRSLENYETVLNGLEINGGSTATAQVIASNTEGEAPSRQELRELYYPEDGRIKTKTSDSVSKLSASW